MSAIGQKIKEIVALRGMSKTELSRRLNMSSTNIHKIFKRDSIDTELLQRLSEQLNYNFFSYYVSKNNDLPTLAEDTKGSYQTEQQLRLEQLEKELALMQKEILYLKEINELLRSANKKK